MADTPPEAAEANPGTATVELSEPIKRGEQTIASITLTKPRGGALRGLSLQDLLRTDVVAMLTLIPRISNPPLTVPEVNNLGADDLAEIAGVVRGFFMSATERKIMTTMIEEFAPKT
ncbi:phage tail assembly protein [Novosphingobium sp. SG720]|uniref:phage tail assembly protein n=1 Tax=Novosphingobium sp. SG720 TaxID=2586998 RepID=UPI001445A0BA|nr:phage tail assembly protein [Novosphingobium sp. SG720]NKJ43173.1 hypothetical protein [Novosphingobium sp. SG720]